MQAVMVHKREGVCVLYVCVTILLCVCKYLSLATFFIAISLLAYPFRVDAHCSDIFRVLYLSLHS